MGVTADAGLGNRRADTGQITADGLSLVQAAASPLSVTDAVVTTAMRTAVVTAAVALADVLDTTLVVVLPGNFTGADAPTAAMTGTSSPAAAMTATSSPAATMTGA